MKNAKGLSFTFIATCALLTTIGHNLLANEQAPRVADFYQRSEPTISREPSRCVTYLNEHGEAVCRVCNGKDVGRIGETTVTARLGR